MTSLCYRKGVRRSRTARLVTRLLLSGLLSGATMSTIAIAQSVAEDQATTAPYAAYVTEASRRFGLPQRWIRAVMEVESAGRVRAVSDAGAMDLMQIMPDTWDDLRIRHRLGRDPFDPPDNILAGTAYLREMFNSFGSLGFLAAYNAGP
jgi:soluble lytic murein transglycosylase-like protein